MLVLTIVGPTQSIVN